MSSLRAASMSETARSIACAEPGAADVRFIPNAHGSALIPNFYSQASLPARFLAGRGIGVTPTCSSAVYGAP